MKIWIVCTGEPDAPGRCTGPEFEAWMAAAPEQEPVLCTEKAMHGEGRRVLHAPGTAARRTAEQLFPGALLEAEPLLSPIPEKAFRDGKASLPFFIWRRMARLQSRTANPRQPESQKQAIRRLDALIDRLMREGDEHTLICDCVLTPLLTDRLRLRGCSSIRRSGMLRFRPYERLLVTGQDLHCGGCVHNCFLSSPGCGIGREKAARLAQGYRA